MAISSIGSLAGGLSPGQAAARPGTSSFSQALASASGSQLAAKTSSAAQAATPQQQYNQSLSDLQRTLAGLFGGAGIDSSQPIAIEQGPEGTLSVSNGHPDADKIEQVLASHPELVTKFKTVAANLRVVQQAASPQAPPAPASASLIVTLVGTQATANLV